MPAIIHEIKKEPFTYIAYEALTPNPHLHNEIELIYVEKGEAVAHINCKQYNLSNGSLLITFPNQVHFFPMSSQGKYHVIIFSPSIIFGINQLLNDYVPKTSVISIENNPYTIELIDKLINEVGVFSQTKRAGILNLLMAKILQMLELEACLKSDNIALQAILNYCENHSESDLSLETVSRALHFNKYYISRLLNKKLNLSFNSYINHIRTNKACRLLTHTNKKISDISEEVGFGSIRTFNRAFVDIMNISPSKYRNQFKAK